MLYGQECISAVQLPPILHMNCIELRCTDFRFNKCEWDWQKWRFSFVCKSQNKKMIFMQFTVSRSRFYWKVELPEAITNSVCIEHSEWCRIYFHVQLPYLTLVRCFLFSVNLCFLCTSFCFLSRRIFWILQTNHLQ